MRKVHILLIYIPHSYEMAGVISEDKHWSTSVEILANLGSRWLDERKAAAMGMGHTKEVSLYEIR